jgi:thiol:disulfide interchange protein DsbD
MDGRRPRAYLGAVIRGLLTMLACVLFGAAAFAAPAPVNVQAELVSARAAIAPGETFTVGLRQTIRPGWHTYWRNPGDSGIPTELTWRLPQGFNAGAIEWPAPRAIKIETLVNYGYEGEVLLPVEITAPKDAAGVAHLSAHALWLVCADICVPEETDLALDVPVRATGADDPVWAAKIAAARASVPKPALIAASLAKSGGGWTLALTGGPLAPLLSQHALRAPAFFPFAGDAIDHAAPQKPRVLADRVDLALTPAPNADLGAKPLDGVVTFERKSGDGWVPAAYQISAAPIAATSAPASALGDGGAASLGLLAALGFAFLGGVILNLMPCVFPVLSMKALALARAEPHEARRHGVIFLAGVMATFVGLAGLLIALQAGGAQIGWGFQLQEPLVVAALGLLFFAIALNLLGAYEIGAGAQGLGARLADRGGDAGAFFTGALAVIAATPCTAPFMGAALGFAATQPAFVSLGVFAALGLGFALPFVLIGAAPPLRKLIPTPGPWMETFKQILAFPMFAAAIWLVWVLAQQAGANGLLAMLAAFLGLGFAIWAARRLKQGARRWAAIAAGVLVIAGAGFGVANAGAAAKPGASRAEAWSPARVAELRAAGAPVFVDFTAAWCVTCQVNEQVALHAPDVARTFARRGIVYLQADWTKRDPVIAAALKEHGRAGVPLYLYYAPGAAAPLVLPQLLTPGIVLDAVGTGG